MVEKVFQLSDPLFIQNSFMDSLVYVMIPSLVSFFIIFFAFYILHSYLADKQGFDKERFNKHINEKKQEFRIVIILHQINMAGLVLDSS